MRRYFLDPRVQGGRIYGTAQTSNAIYQAVLARRIKVRKIIARETDRLDVMAGIAYGDSTLWWVIAAASGIGWGLQVPAGTVISVPVELGEVAIFAGA